MHKIQVQKKGQDVADMIMDIAGAKSVKYFSNGTVYSVRAAI